MNGAISVIEAISSYYLIIALFGVFLFWESAYFVKTRQFVEKDFANHLLSNWLKYITLSILIMISIRFSEGSVTYTLVSSLILLYIIRDSRSYPVSPWPVMLVPLFVITLSWWEVVIQFGQGTLDQLSSPIVSAPLAFLAALFAYVGWQETANNKRHSVEEALNNRYQDRRLPDFSGHQIIQQSPKVSIEMIEVWETSRPLKKAFKYLPTKQFQGTTTLRIEFLTPDESVNLSDLWRLLNSYPSVLSTTQYNKSKFTISINSTKIRGVDEFIKEKFIGSIPGLSDEYITIFDSDTKKTLQMVRKSSSENTTLFFNDSDLELGSRVTGCLEYNPIEIVELYPFHSKEIREIRRINQSDNIYTWIYPDHDEIHADPLVIRGKATDKRYPNRFLLSLRQSHIPEQFRSLQPEARPERFRSVVQGLEIVRRRFVDTNVIQITDREYTSGGEYSTLDVSINPTQGDSLSERIDFDGVCHVIPIEDFKPSEHEYDTNSSEVKSEYDLEDILSAKLSAEYAFANQYDIGAIYSYEDVYPVFLWRENGDCVLAQIAPDLANALKPSIIWERS